MLPGRFTKFLKIFLSIAAALLIAFAVFFFGFAARLVADSINGVVKPPPYDASPAAQLLHKDIFVADMHCDALSWGRDLTIKNSGGHVDIPRMFEGKIDLQAFTVVIKSPRRLNNEKTDDKSDNIFWLALAQMQPLENLTSLTKRALWQAKQLHYYAEKSGGKLIIIKNKRDLQNFLARRGTEKVVGGWLGIEGAHALDGDINNIDVLYDAGFRMMSPSHFFD